MEAGGARIMGVSHAMALFRNALWLKLHFKKSHRSLLGWLGRRSAEGVNKQRSYSGSRPGAGPCGEGPWLISHLLLPALQHPAHRAEGEVPELALHGLAGDAVPGPQTSCHPDPRKPGERAHLLLPVASGLAVPAQSLSAGDAHLSTGTEGVPCHM